jgi:hypothetical protein
LPGLYLRLKSIKKQDRTLFLPLFEDYQKLNNELAEVVNRIKKECGDILKNCKDFKNCKIDFSKYPVLSRITEREELIAFKPDLITSSKFLEFFEKNRHLLGYENPTKALITIVKELVDNSLDACEEARILPNIKISLKEIGGEMLVVSQFTLYGDCRKGRRPSFTDAEEPAVAKTFTKIG